MSIIFSNYSRYMVYLITECIYNIHGYIYEGCGINDQR